MAFKKGQSGNPNGRPPLSPEIKQARALSAHEFILEASELLRKTPKELQQLLLDADNISASKVMIAALIKNAALGDSKSFNAIIDRVIGKPTERIELSGPEGGAIKTQTTIELEAMSDEELRVLSKVLKRNELPDDE